MLKLTLLKLLTLKLNGLFNLFLCLLLVCGCSKNHSPQRHPYLGRPIYIQIFKEESTLDVYTYNNRHYKLTKRYDICHYSGGLGPKKIELDLKTPEGFYSASSSQLNPNSAFYKSINLGYPNKYDQAHGYTGSLLMIHGKCQSIGCFAMNDLPMEEIYQWVEYALANGQNEVLIHIFPFRMTAKNMSRHQHSPHFAFWQQLKPGYNYFLKYQRPPEIKVVNGQYII